MAVVYLHKNPETKEVFYVGMSTKDDLKRPYSKSGRNSDWHDYVEKNGKPIVEILEKGITTGEAYKLEIELIKKFGRKIYGMGSLVNFTKGGDPVNQMLGENNPMYGKKHTEESKGILSKINKVKSKGILNGMYGKKHTEESKKKISLSRKGKYVGHKSPTSKLVLDTSTGIFYECLKYCVGVYNNYSYGYLKEMLNGRKRNKTNLIYC